MAYAKQNIKVLFGFDVLAHEKKVITELRGHGYEVQAHARYTKQLIQEFVNTTPDLDVVIIKEYLDGGGMYSVDEITALVEDNDVNVVVLLDPYHRGKEFMQNLLNAGITNAVFQENRRGVNPEVIAGLACKKRSRREARAYYRIRDLRVDLDVLNYEQFSEYYQYMMNENYGINGTDRFLTIMKWLSPKRAADFIKKLPEEVIVQLKTTNEFYDVLDELRARGLQPMPGKRPRKISMGIPPGSFARQVIEQFGPPKDISVRTMDGSYNPASFEDIPYGEEVTLDEIDLSEEKIPEKDLMQDDGADDEKRVAPEDYAANLQKLVSISNLGKLSLNEIVTLLEKNNVR